MCRNQVYLIFANNSRSKKNKKNPTHAFVEIGKQETCEKFRQKMLNCRAVRARQMFQIFRQNPWFLENNRGLPKYLYGILHYCSTCRAACIQPIQNKELIITISIIKL